MIVLVTVMVIFKDGHDIVTMSIFVVCCRRGCVDVILFLGYYLCCVVYLLLTANSLEQVSM